MRLQVGRSKINCKKIREKTEKGKMERERRKKRKRK